MWENCVAKENFGDKNVTMALSLVFYQVPLLFCHVPPCPKPAASLTILVLNNLSLIPSISHHHSFVWCVQAVFPRVPSQSLGVCWVLSGMWKSRLDSGFCTRNFHGLNVIPAFTLAASTPSVCLFCTEFTNILSTCVVTPLPKIPAKIILKGTHQRGTSSKFPPK